MSNFILRGPLLFCATAATYYQQRQQRSSSFVIPRLAYCKKDPSFSVFTWGNGLQGQLGHGSNCNQPLPTVIEAFQLDDTVVQCTCGSSHTACVTATGKVFTWGRTQDNRLGHGDEGGSSLDQSVPKDIEGLRVSKVACGEFHMLAVDSDGKVYSWGKNTRGQCGRPNPQQKDEDDDVWAHRRGVPPLSVGLVQEGFPQQCRIVDWTTMYQTPKPSSTLFVQIKSVMNSGANAVFRVAVSVEKVSCGKHHSIALSEDGDVYIWGYGGEGQLGLGSEAMREKRVQTVPIALSRESFGQQRVVQIAAGGQFSAAITEDGKLYTWGSDQYGQLGHGKESWSVPAPKIVRGLLKHPVAQVSCGQCHMAVVTTAHEVFTWGYGREGQLGHGTRTDVSIPTLVDQLGQSNVSVACGGGHTAVVSKTEDGLTLFMFGRGREGQLGRAKHLESVVAYRTDPVEVELPLNNKPQYLQVACGHDYTLAVCSENASSPATA